MLPVELSGPWACGGDHLRAIVASTPATAADFRRSGAGRGGFELFDDVAIIRLDGVLSKAGSWWFNGTSTVDARHQIAAAVADPRVKKIALVIYSPGGTVDGTYELAGDIAAAAKRKTTVAFIQDLGASGAFWAASQASQVFASPTALIGAIGTYAVLIDTSGLAEKLGTKVHIVRAGQFKGMGTPGTAVEKAHLAEAQRLIDARNEFFLQAVAAGRKLPMAKVRELADGRVHLAADAKRLGLIDGVQSFQTTLAHLAVMGTGFASQTTTAAASGISRKGSPMSEREYTGDAIADFETAVSEQMAKGKTRQEAIQIVALRNRDLHAAYVAQSNLKWREQTASRR